MDELNYPTGVVFRRARGCYLAHMWDDQDGGEFYDAFTTEEKAMRWIENVLNEQGVGFRWEFDPTRNGLVCYTLDVG